MIRRRQVVWVRQLNPHQSDGDLVLLEGLFDHGLEANGIVADGLRDFLLLAAGIQLRHG